jgi:hypothetical protein
MASDVAISKLRRSKNKVKAASQTIFFPLIAAGRPSNFCLETKVTKNSRLQSLELKV